MKGRMLGVCLVVACGGSTAPPGGDAAVGEGDVTVTPARIDDVLANPNMGFADFHLGWLCNLPPITFTPEQCAARARASRPKNYPANGVAYFRWTWKDLEPVRGQLDVDLIDAAIQSAHLLDETLAIRVMTIEENGSGVPAWLQAPPYSVPGQTFGSTFWPDYRSATYQAEHARFIAALGARYNDHPAIDHVDIGAVGCWGEWNTACLTGPTSIIDVFAPADEAARDQVADAYRHLIDHYVTAFPTTPLVMLALDGQRESDVFAHALQAGAGWRVDCWGDWGWFSPNWSHQANLYPTMIADATMRVPAFGDVWKHAPIQLEVCATIQGWHDRGWTTAAPDGEVYKSFQFALDQHAAVLNAKRSDIPDDYLPAVDDLLRHNGYRYVIDTFNHHSTVHPGGPLVFVTSWSNLGVTPSYTRRTVRYRLVGAADTRTFDSTADVRTWLPGSWQARESFTVPRDLAPGTYEIQVAITDREGTNPTTTPLPPLQLGIAGRAPDGWYRLSSLIVAPD